MSFALRTTFYSLTLAFGVFQTIVACMNTIFSEYGFAPFMQIFAGITLGWATITWIWTSVLLSYNNRPLSSHGLTRALPHFASFTVFAVGWLALTIMLGQQFPLQCDFKAYSDGEAYLWCPLGATSFGLSFVLFAFCVTSAAIVYFSARRTGAGLSANVAHADKMESTA
ncbi:hypothetical protein LshimejAT787_0701110 [Lyophyllum shimeji]|uniref:MARVEL domain-containing protein n=1 Tax=Lyophyllum shimeji TaxID=47721 RepID=A0A9P3PQN1_LYOSH|nr:hypothetical protein LshimejAT787_0701110 [Lyophyllum shimeji]